MTDQRTVDPVPTTAETAAASRQRGRAIAGALSGVAVVVLLVVVFALVRSGGDEETPAASAPAASAPAEQPPAAAEPSAPAGAEEPPAGAEQPPAAGGPEIDPALREKPEVTGGKGTLDKLKVTALVKGKGAKVAAGQQIVVNYVGVTYADGKEFDSSWQRQQPFPLAIGVGQVIPGWDEGLVGVTVGSRVQLDIPAEMAYGENPSGGAPAGDLRFVVDVLQAQ